MNSTASNMGMPQPQQPPSGGGGGGGNMEIQQGMQRLSQLIQKTEMTRHALRNQMRMTRGGPTQALSAESLPPEMAFAAAQQRQQLQQQQQQMQQLQQMQQQGFGQPQQQQQQQQQQQYAAAAAAADYMQQSPQMNNNNSHHNNFGNTDAVNAGMADLNQMAQALQHQQQQLNAAAANINLNAAAANMSDLEYEQNIMIMQQQLQLQQLQLKQMQQQRAMHQAALQQQQQQQQQQQLLPQALPSIPLQLQQQPQQRQSASTGFGMMPPPLSVDPQQQQNSSMGYNTNNTNNNTNTDNHLQGRQPQQQPQLDDHGMSRRGSMSRHPRMMMQNAPNINRPRRTDGQANLPTASTRRGGRKPSKASGLDDSNSELPSSPKKNEQDSAPRKPPKRSISGTHRTRPEVPERTHSGFMSIGSDEKSGSAAGGELTLEEYRQQLEEYIATHGGVVGGGGGAEAGKKKVAKMRADGNDSSNDSSEGTDSDLDSDLEDDWEHEKAKRLARQARKKNKCKSKASKKKSPPPQAKASAVEPLKKAGVNRHESGISMMSMDSRKSEAISLFSNLSDISAPEALKPPGKLGTSPAMSTTSKHRGVNRALSGVSYMSELTELSQTMDELVIQPLEHQPVMESGEQEALTAGKRKKKKNPRA